MKIKKIFIGLLVLFTFVFSSQVFAAGAISVSTKGPVLASVGLGDYKILSQENNKIVISFNLSNEGEVQTGVRYGIKLVKEIDKSQFLADEKVYDESLTLLSGSTVKKEITYIAPSNLDGEYGILLTSRNEAGLIFGISYVGKVKLTSSTKGIVIAPESCKLSIPGEKNKYVKYNLLQGVDISSTESLQLNCSATNTDTKTITATPSFETHFRTLYGDIVPHTKVENTPISFEAGEKKDIKILLPKALKPQAYDVKVSLDYGNEKSNTIVAHYVIQGVSATIQNLSLDKDFYEKGETAQMFFSWSQSADGFPGSRLGKASTMPEVYIDAKITNNYGLNCIDPIKQLLPVDHNTLKNDISAPIKRTCVNPQVSIFLIDKDGNVLDQKDFNVETSTREKTSLINRTNIIIAIIILILIIVLVSLYIKHKKGKNGGNSSSQINVPVAMFIALFTLVSVGINFPVFKTSAMLDILMAVNGSGSSGSTSGETTIVPGDSTGVTPTGLAATFSFPYSSYDPGQTAVLTTAMYYTGCTNVTRDLVATGRVIGNAYAGNTYVGQPLELFNTTIQGQVDNSQDTPINLPSTPGNYYLDMEIKGYVPTSYDAIDYTDQRGPVINTHDFSTFKDALIDYIFSYYTSQPSYDFITPLYNAPSIDAITTILQQENINMMVTKTGGELAFTREYEFYPIKVRGVDVTVNDSKNPTITQGGSALVEWTAINPTYGCKCIFSPAVNGSNFCGLSLPNATSGSNRVDGVSANTTFNVSCKDFEQTQ